jgi:hypothetical protein
MRELHDAPMAWPKAEAAGRARQSKEWRVGLKGCTQGRARVGKDALAWQCLSRRCLAGLARRARALCEHSSGATSRDEPGKRAQPGGEGGGSR